MSHWGAAAGFLDWRPKSLLFLLQHPGRPPPWGLAGFRVNSTNSESLLDCRSSPPAGPTTTRVLTFAGLLLPEWPPLVPQLWRGQSPDLQGAPGGCKVLTLPAAGGQHPRPLSAAALVPWALGINAGLEGLPTQNPGSVCRAPRRTYSFTFHYSVSYSSTFLFFLSASTLCRSGGRQRAPCWPLGGHQGRDGGTHPTCVQMTARTRDVDC